MIMNDASKVKYILADILPICGECNYFYRYTEFSDKYETWCKNKKTSNISFVLDACSEFKPK